MLDGSPILAIVTFDSRNAKTGAMAQLWILPDVGVLPMAAARSGLDAGVCGSCPYRPVNAHLRPEGALPCYVDLSKAPRSAYLAAVNRAVDLDGALAALRKGQDAVRLGAYGDPAALPESLVTALVGAATAHTGYTHQWRDPRFAWLRSYVMASADSPADYARAAAEGWRTFRVLPRRMLPVLAAREILCPSERVECIDCRLCAGSTGPTDRRKSIAIVSH